MEPDMEAGASLHVPTTARKHEIRCFLMLAALILAPLIALLIFVFTFPDPDRRQILVPTFSVDLAGFDGLDGATSPPPFVSPTFNLTLHGFSTSQSSEWGPAVYPTFWSERGTVAVSYTGAVLAWGRAPAFCIPEGAQKHVRLVALGAGVELSDELRVRMASERRSRSAEVDVDIVLHSYVYYWKRYLSCRVKLDEEPSRQPSPCKVLVSHIW